MKKLLYILFFLSCVLPTLAQKNISGTVTDKTDNQALAGISIFIPELQRKTITGASGKFTFENAGEGIVTLQFTGIGYKSQVTTVNLASEQKELAVTMETSSTELEEVTVTSNYVKLPDNIPYSANTVSLGEIRKYSSPSVMGNLSYQPGVDRITIGNGIGKPVIRGLSFNRIMLYAQGTRIENQQWDDHHDLGLMDVGIDNIEIVRGPAALIYGADALGGALIFNDEKPAAVGTVEKDFSVGFFSNTMGFSGEFGLKGTGKKGIFYGIRIASNLHTSYLQGEGETDIKPAGGKEEEFAFNSKFISSIGKINIGMSKPWGMSKFSYSFLSQQIGIVEIEPDSVLAGGGEEDEQRELDVEAPMQNVNTQIFSLENVFLTGNSKLNVNLAWQINDRGEFEPVAGNKHGELAVGLLLNTATYDVKWTSNAEKSFGITLGSQGTFLTNENNGKEMLVPNADVSDIAGYGLFRYDKGKLNLLGGVRFDARRIEVEGEEGGEMEEDSFIIKSTGDTILRPESDFEKEYSPFSFSLGLAYELTKNLKAKLNAATGFSAPNYAELATFGKHEGTFRFERGYSDLNFEQNTEGDLGLIWENEFITLNLGGYINKIKDYIYIENTGDSIIRIRPQGIDTLPVYDYRQNDATISGGEFGFDIHPETAKWFDLKATYALINGELDKGGNLPYIPANKLVGEIRLSKEKIGKLQSPFVSFVVSNYGEQTNVAEYELPTDAYTLFDVLLGATLKLGKNNADIHLFCTNLLNEGYFNHLSLIKPIGIKDMGRNIGFRFSMKFMKEKK